MLLKLLKRWLGGPAPGSPRREKNAALLEQAQSLMLSGDNQGAIQAYREYLKDDPYNVVALNDLGACLVDTGDIPAAVASLELAYSLDDTFVPVMVNYAKLLNDDYKRGEDALRILRRAKVARPEFSHTDAVYAGVCFKRGDGLRAARFQQRAWMANFDSLRLANGAMFWGSYDTPEKAIASEHRFWAETLRPLDPPAHTEPPRATARGRVRIGYWSPDFRGHSVRFFFRPLLENHDRERFEVVLFHDCPIPDAQTERIRAAAEHFHDVHEMPDAQLREFIRSQELDILVDLAGHTSFNRLSLMQDRLATLQVNALGYPPTTGLRTMDAKLIDRHVATSSDDCSYSEEPMVLEGSFWCYDPMDDVELPAPPPVLEKGYVTFGCVGNIAKITPPLMAAWKRILDRVEKSRLLIRSINFEDAIAYEGMRARIEAAGLPADRIDLYPPKGGADFYRSYHEIDLILDTFPFNGGTTTCFATYMGVPVVTLAGESLVSRMGLSVMTNLGAPELVAFDLDEYVERAVAAASDTAFLERFRREARPRYLSTPLGNGAMFAREFEQACERMLADKARGGATYAAAIPPLPENEIMRRAYAVIRRGQVDAAERVLAHCLSCYPGSGKPHLLKAQLLVWGKDPGDAITYLRERMQSFAPADHASALLVIARICLLAGNAAGARDALGELGALPLDDPFDRLQAALYQACATASPAELPAQAPAQAENVLVVVPCDEKDRFKSIRAQVTAACSCPAGWTIRFVSCGEAQRIAAYQDALRTTDASLVVLLQKNVQVHQPQFLLHVQSALARADVVACAGARRWSRLDWRLDDFAQKTGAFIAPSSEKEGLWELHCFGSGTDPIDAQMAVLDASVLALRPGDLPPFEEKFLSAGTLLEESWSWQCGQAGLRLAAHRNLGVVIDPTIALDESDRTEARVACALDHAFDPFADESDDFLSVSAPVARPSDAVRACAAFVAAGDAHR